MRSGELQRAVLELIYDVKCVFFLYVFVFFAKMLDPLSCPDPFPDGMMIWWYGMIWWYVVIWYDDMIWCDMIWWYDMIWCDMMIWWWCDDVMIWYDMIWHDMIWWYDMTWWYDMMIWYDMIWYGDMIWCDDVIWYDDMMWYDVRWYDDMICHDMIWHDMIWWYEMIWKSEEKVFLTYLPSDPSPGGKFTAGGEAWGTHILPPAVNLPPVRGWPLRVGREGGAPLNLN